MRVVQIENQTQWYVQHLTEVELYLPLVMINSLGSYPVTGREESWLEAVVLWKVGFSRAASNVLIGGAIQRNLSSLNTI